MRLRKLPGLVRCQADETSKVLALQEVEGAFSVLEVAGVLGSMLDTRLPLIMDALIPCFKLDAQRCLGTGIAATNPVFFSFNPLGQSIGDSVLNAENSMKVVRSWPFQERASGDVSNEIPGLSNPTWNEKSTSRKYDTGKYVAKVCRHFVRREVFQRLQRLWKNLWLKTRRVSLLYGLCQCLTDTARPGLASPSIVALGLLFTSLRTEKQKTRNRGLHQTDDALGVGVRQFFNFPQSDPLDHVMKCICARTTHHLRNDCFDAEILAIMDRLITILLSHSLFLLPVRIISGQSSTVDTDSVLQICLAVQLLGDIAENVGSADSRLLIRVVYPLVACASGDDINVSDAAAATLHRVATASG